MLKLQLGTLNVKLKYIFFKFQINCIITLVVLTVFLTHCKIQPTMHAWIWKTGISIGLVKGNKSSQEGVRMRRVFTDLVHSVSYWGTTKVHVAPGLFTVKIPPNTAAVGGHQIPPRVCFHAVFLKKKKEK